MDKATLIDRLNWQIELLHHCLNNNKLTSLLVNTKDELIPLLREIVMKLKNENNIQHTK